MRFVSRHPRDTQKIAQMLFQEMKRAKAARSVIGLMGELGSGKTTFVQGFVRALGLKEQVRSPTFVLMKVYKTKFGGGIKHMVHVDCYRLDDPLELLHFGLRPMMKDRDAVVLIEWADRVKKILPKNTFWVRFQHGKKPHERIISFGA